MKHRISPQQSQLIESLSFLLVFARFRALVVESITHTRFKLTFRRFYAFLRVVIVFIRVDVEVVAL